MYQKDYILRMIEMLGDLLRGIFGFIDRKDFYGASQGLEKIYYDMLKQESAFFKDIPANDLTTKLLQEHNYTGGHLEILAELFNVEAELELARSNKAESLEFSQKSLILFEFVDQDQKTFIPERIKKMGKIRDRIDSLSRPE
jgi:hypothetical protein